MNGKQLIYIVWLRGHTGTRLEVHEVAFGDDLSRTVTVKRHHKPEGSARRRVKCLNLSGGDKIPFRRHVKAK